MSTKDTAEWLGNQDNEDAKRLATILNLIEYQVCDTDGLVMAYSIAPRDYFSGMLDHFLSELMPLIWQACDGDLNELSFYIPLTTDELIAMCNVTLQSLDDLEKWDDEDNE